MSFARRVKAKVLTMSCLAPCGLALDQLSSLTANHPLWPRHTFCKHTRNSELLGAFVLSLFISALPLQLFACLVPFRSQGGWSGEALGRRSVTFPHSVSVMLRQVTTFISFGAFIVVCIDLVYLLTISHCWKDKSSGPNLVLYIPNLVTSIFLAPRRMARHGHPISICWQFHE